MAKRTWTSEPASLKREVSTSPKSLKPESVLVSRALLGPRGGQGSSVSLPENSRAKRKVVTHQISHFAPQHF